jgi:hypothetical protein
MHPKTRETGGMKENTVEKNPKIVAPATNGVAITFAGIEKMFTVCVIRKMIGVDRIETASGTDKTAASNSPNMPSNQDAIGLENRIIDNVESAESAKPKETDLYGSSNIKTAAVADNAETD